MRTIALICLLAFVAGVCSAQWVPTNGPTLGPWYLPWTYSLATSSSESGSDLFAGTDYGLVFRTTDNGGTWIRTDGRGPTSIDTGFANRSVSALALTGGYIFAGTIYSLSPSDARGIFRCSIKDTHWVAVNNGLADLHVWCLMACPYGTGDTALYAGTRGGVFRSTDNGENWVARSEGLVGLDVDALAFNKNDSGQVTLFASARGGGGGGVHVSTDAGEHWTFQPESPYAPRSIAVMRKPTGQVLVFAGSGATLPSGVFQSSDNGTSWTPVNIGMPQNSQILAFAVHDTILYASVYAPTRSGIYYYGGTQWSYGSTTGLTGALALSVCDTNLFAGLSGLTPSVWRRPLSQMLNPTGVDDGDIQTPFGFSLEQNYPNPFNPSTNFKFTIVNRELTILKVYDLLGREVATLVNEVKEPGTYEATWDASGVASGVYFYQLRAGSFFETRKMLLMK